MSDGAELVEGPPTQDMETFLESQGPGGIEPASVSDLMLRSWQHEQVVCT